MSTPIILQDYSPIPPENQNIELCEKIQKAIDDGRCNILNLADFMAGKSESASKKKNDDDEGAYPKVFAIYNKKYSAKKYAGILTYQGHTVIINSRFDQIPTGDSKNDKTYFLQYALEKIEWNKLHIRYFMNMPARGGGGALTQLLIPIFLHQVQEAYRVGVFRQYRNFQHNDSKFRGPIDIPRHIRMNPISNGKIAYNTREYTIDNPTNHLILATRRLLEQREDTKVVLEQILSDSPELDMPFQRLGWELGVPEVKRSQINGIIADNRNPITHPFHRRYEDVRKTALKILQNEGLQLMTDDSDEVNAILIPMDKVWERLLEYTLFCNRQKAVSAQKQIKILSEVLPQTDETDGEKSRWNARRILKPDFFENDGAYVLDAKYRKPWENAYRDGRWTSYVRDDVFQVLSYLYAAKSIHGQSTIRGGILFPYPRDQKEAIPPVKEFAIFRGDFGDRFYLFPYPVECSRDYSEYRQYQVAMDAHCDETNPDCITNRVLSILEGECQNSIEKI